MTPKEIVKECTDNGTHLNSCDDDGFFFFFCYQESLEDFDEE